MFYLVAISDSNGLHRPQASNLSKVKHRFEHNSILLEATSSKWALNTTSDANSWRNKRWQAISS